MINFNSNKLSILNDRSKTYNKNNNCFNAFLRNYKYIIYNHFIALNVYKVYFNKHTFISYLLKTLEYLQVLFFSYFFIGYSYNINSFLSNNNLKLDVSNYINSNNIDLVRYNLIINKLILYLCSLFTIFEFGTFINKFGFYLFLIIIINIILLHIYDIILSLKLHIGKNNFCSFLNKDELKVYKNIKSYYNINYFTKINQTYFKKYLHESLNCIINKFNTNESYNSTFNINKINYLFFYTRLIYAFYVKFLINILYFPICVLLIGHISSIFNKNLNNEIYYTNSNTYNYYNTEYNNYSLSSNDNNNIYNYTNSFYQISSIIILVILTVHNFLINIFEGEHYISSYSEEINYTYSFSKSSFLTTYKLILAFYYVNYTLIANVIIYKIISLLILNVFVIIHLFKNQKYSIKFFYDIENYALIFLNYFSILNIYYYFIAKNNINPFIFDIYYHVKVLNNNKDIPIIEIIINLNYQRILFNVLGSIIYCLFINMILIILYKSKDIKPIYVLNENEITSKINKLMLYLKNFYKLNNNERNNLFLILKEEIINSHLLVCNKNLKNNVINNKFENSNKKFCSENNLNNNNENNTNKHNLSNKNIENIRDTNLLYNCNCYNYIDIIAQSIFINLNNSEFDLLNNNLIINSLNTKDNPNAINLNNNNKKDIESNNEIIKSVKKINKSKLNDVEDKNICINKDFADNNDNIKLLQTNKLNKINKLSFKSNLNNKIINFESKNILNDQYSSIKSNTKINIEKSLDISNKSEEFELNNSSNSDVNSELNINFDTVKNNSHVYKKLDSSYKHNINLNSFVSYNNLSKNNHSNDLVTNNNIVTIKDVNKNNSYTNNNNLNNKDNEYNNTIMINKLLNKTDNNNNNNKENDFYNIDKSSFIKSSNSKEKSNVLKNNTKIADGNKQSLNIISSLYEHVVNEFKTIKNSGGINNESITRINNFFLYLNQDNKLSTLEKNKVSYSLIEYCLRNILLCFIENSKILYPDNLIINLLYCELLMYYIGSYQKAWYEINKLYCMYYNKDRYLKYIIKNENNINNYSNNELYYTLNDKTNNNKFNSENNVVYNIYKDNYLINDVKIKIKSKKSLLKSIISKIFDFFSFNSFIINYVLKKYYIFKAKLHFEYNIYKILEANNLSLIDTNKILCYNLINDEINTLISENNINIYNLWDSIYTNKTLFNKNFNHNKNNHKEVIEDKKDALNEKDKTINYVNVPENSKNISKNYNIFKNIYAKAYNLQNLSYEIFVINKLLAFRMHELYINLSCVKIENLFKAKILCNLCYSSIDASSNYMLPNIIMNIENTLNNKAIFKNILINDKNLKPNFNNKFYREESTDTYNYNTKSKIHSNIALSENIKTSELKTNNKNFEFNKLNKIKTSEIIYSNSLFNLNKKAVSTNNTDNIIKYYKDSTSRKNDYDRSPSSISNSLITNISTYNLINDKLDEYNNNLTKNIYNCVDKIATFIVSNDINLFGKIIYHNNELLNLIDANNERYLLNNTINILLPDYIAMFHDSFIKIFNSTSKTRIINKSVILFVKSRYEYIVPVYTYIKIIPNIADGFKFITIFKKLTNKDSLLKAKKKYSISSLNYCSKKLFIKDDANITNSFTYKNSKDKNKTSFNDTDNYNFNLNKKYSVYNSFKYIDKQFIFNNSNKFIQSLSDKVSIILTTDAPNYFIIGANNNFLIQYGIPISNIFQNFNIDNKKLQLDIDLEFNKTNNNNNNVIIRIFDILSEWKSIEKVIYNNSKDNSFFNLFPDNIINLLEVSNIHNIKKNEGIITILNSRKFLSKFEDYIEMKKNNNNNKNLSYNNFTNITDENKNNYFSYNKNNKGFYEYLYNNYYNNKENISKAHFVHVCCSTFYYNDNKSKILIFKIVNLNSHSFKSKYSLDINNTPKINKNIKNYSYSLKDNQSNNSSVNLSNIINTNEFSFNHSNNIENNQLSLNNNKSNTKTSSLNVSYNNDNTKNYINLFNNKNDYLKLRPNNNFCEFVKYNKNSDNLNNKLDFDNIQKLSIKSNKITKNNDKNIGYNMSIENKMSLFKKNVTKNSQTINSLKNTKNMSNKITNLFLIYEFLNKFKEKVLLYYSKNIVQNLNINNYNLFNRKLKIAILILVSIVIIIHAINFYVIIKFYNLIENFLYSYSYKLSMNKIYYLINFKYNSLIMLNNNKYDKRILNFNREILHLKNYIKLYYRYKEKLLYINKYNKVTKDMFYENYYLNYFSINYGEILDKHNNNKNTSLINIDNLIILQNYVINKNKLDNEVDSQYNQILAKSVKNTVKKISYKNDELLDISENVDYYISYINDLTYYNAIPHISNNTSFKFYYINNETNNLYENLYDANNKNSLKKIIQLFLDRENIVRDLLIDNTINFIYSYDYLVHFYFNKIIYAFNSYIQYVVLFIFFLVLIIIYLRCLVIFKNLMCSCMLFDNSFLEKKYNSIYKKNQLFNYYNKNYSNIKDTKDLLYIDNNENNNSKQDNTRNNNSSYNTKNNNILASNVNTISSNIINKNYECQNLNLETNESNKNLIKNNITKYNTIESIESDNNFFDKSKKTYNPKVKFSITSPSNTKNQHNKFNKSNSVINNYSDAFLDENEYNIINNKKFVNEYNNLISSEVYFGKNNYEFITKLIEKHASLFENKDNFDKYLFDCLIENSQNSNIDILFDAKKHFKYTYFFKNISKNSYLIKILISISFVVLMYISFYLITQILLIPIDKRIDFETFKSINYLNLYFNGFFYLSYTMIDLNLNTNCLLDTKYKNTFFELEKYNYENFKNIYNVSNKNTHYIPSKDNYINLHYITKYLNNNNNNKAFKNHNEYNFIFSIINYLDHQTKNSNLTNCDIINYINYELNKAKYIVADVSLNLETKYKQENIQEIYSNNNISDYLYFRKNILLNNKFTSENKLERDLYILNQKDMFCLWLNETYLVNKNFYFNRIKNNDESTESINSLLIDFTNKTNYNLNTENLDEIEKFFYNYLSYSISYNYSSCNALYNNDKIKNLLLIDSRIQDQIYSIINYIEILFNKSKASINTDQKMKISYFYLLITEFINPTLFYIEDQAFIITKNKLIEHKRFEYLMFIVFILINILSIYLYLKINYYLTQLMKNNKYFIELLLGNQFLVDYRINALIN